MDIMYTNALLISKYFSCQMSPISVCAVDLNLIFFSDSTSIYLLIELTIQYFDQRYSMMIITGPLTTGDIWPGEQNVIILPFINLTLSHTHKSLNLYKDTKQTITKNL